MKGIDVMADETGEIVIYQRITYIDVGKVTWKTSKLQVMFNMQPKACIKLWTDKMNKQEAWTDHDVSSVALQKKDDK